MALDRRLQEGAVRWFLPRARFVCQGWTSQKVLGSDQDWKEGMVESKASHFSVEFWYLLNCPADTIIWRLALISTTSAHLKAQLVPDKQSLCSLGHCFVEGQRPMLGASRVSRAESKPSKPSGARPIQHKVIIGRDCWEHHRDGPSFLLVFSHDSDLLGPGRLLDTRKGALFDLQKDARSVRTVRPFVPPDRRSAGVHLRQHAFAEHRTRHGSQAPAAAAPQHPC